MPDSLIPLLTFDPILKEKPWGGSFLARMKGLLEESGRVGESWEVSAFPGDVSVVQTAAYKGKNLTELVQLLRGRLVGHKVYQRYGNQFPLLFKFIHSEDDLSLQVHPDDVLARRRGLPCGKTEMWYVYRAAEGASLYSGFKADVTREQYLQSIRHDSLASLLKPWTTHEGDTFFISAGNVHALRRGNVVIEVQQTSDTTYRLYDYNRKGLDGHLRPLHIEESLEAVDYSARSSKVDYQPVQEGASLLVECPYFVTSLHQYSHAVQLDFSPLDSFVVLIATEGRMEIRDAGGLTTLLSAGHSLLLPASNNHVSLTPLQGPCAFLETHCP